MHSIMSTYTGNWTFRHFVSSPPGRFALKTFYSTFPSHSINFIFYYFKAASNNFY